jgi:uncharacterized protein
VRQVDVVRPDNSVLCRAEVADGMMTRGVGLLGRKGLDDDAGLLIQPCGSVHTWFMRFPIDAVYLDAEDTVLKVAHLKQWRFSMGGKAKKVIELPYMKAQSAGLLPGERLQLKPV